MDKIIGKQLPKKDQDNEHWVSMSDLRKVRTSS